MLRVVNLGGGGVKTGTSAAMSGAGVACNCMVACFGGACIMLDCGLSFDGTTFGTPSWNDFDLERIDAVLISNHYHMMALPLLTEYKGFRRKIYATTPTVAIGRLVLLEYQQYFGVSGSKPTAALQGSRKKLHSGFPQYTVQDIESCISKITAVSYHEILEVGRLTLQAVSSGSYLGSANWVMQTFGQKIVYISDSSLERHHPSLIDIPPLKDADVAIISTLPVPGAVTFMKARQDFAAITAGTVAKGGNVLVPCLSTGIIFDLLDMMEPIKASSFLISPMAHEHLSYTCICAEWLCPEKQEIAYIPNSPFVHLNLQSRGTLSTFPTAIGNSTPARLPRRSFASCFKEPSVVFTGHPSCLSGDVTTFLKLWGTNPRNIVLFIDSHFGPVGQVISSQEYPLSCQVRQCVVDARLSQAQLKSLVDSIRPHHVLVHKQCLFSAANPWSATANASGPVMAIPTTGDNPPFIKISITKACGIPAVITDSELIQALSQTTETTGVEDVQVRTTCFAISKNGDRLTLNNPTLQDMRALSESPRQYLWGSPLLSTFVGALAEQGILCCSVTRTDSGGFRIVISEGGADECDCGTSVTISMTETHIETDSDEMRGILRDIIVNKCLRNF
ncbi:integrator complex subunit 9 [Pelomyxa schiedti]|nr:integrator complex subunit 9 [Pelomyxa schiedti]